MRIPLSRLQGTLVGAHGTILRVLLQVQVAQLPARELGGLPVTQDELALNRGIVRLGERPQGHQR